MSPVRFPAIGQAMWTPKLLPNLITWLDADDLSTITLSGSDVSDWNDKSGSANHVTQATSARRPTRVANSQNGRAALDFMWTTSGAANRKFMQRGNTYTNVTGSALSVFATARPTSNWDTFARLVGFSTSSTSNDFNTTQSISAMLRQSTNSIMYSFYNAAATNTVAVAAGSWYTFGMIVNGTSHTFRLDGTSTTSTLASTPNFNINTITIGHNAGEAGTAAVAWNSLVGEIVVCNTNLSTSNRDKIEGYLAWKWGLAGSLAAGHAYKNFPPPG